MFKIKKHDDPIRWPVQVAEPAHDGAVQRSEFTAHFVMITRSDFERLSGQGDAALVARVLVGWSGIQDDTGADLAFSPELRDLLCDRPPVLTALARAYIQFMAGAAVKN